MSFFEKRGLRFQPILSTAIYDTDKRGNGRVIFWKRHFEGDPTSRRSTFAPVATSLQNICIQKAEVVAQWTAWSLTIPEDLNLNPVIGNFYRTI